MNIASMVSDFETLGVYLWCEQNQLKFKAPKGVLTEEHKQQLRSRKSELIEFLADPVVEAIVPDPDNRHETFPLTDLQLAYLVGRNEVIDYGGVGCHSYIELDLPALDLHRLQHAWHTLIERHDMLRAVISPKGVQRILPTVIPPDIVHHDYQDMGQDEIDDKLATLRAGLAHRRYPPEQWPQYDLHLSSTHNGAILHFSIDLLIADFASIQIILAELGELYNHPERVLKPLGVSYRDIVLAHKSRLDNPPAAVRYEQHKAYWMERIQTMPMPPELPLSPVTTAKGQEVQFKRLGFQVTGARWSELKQKAANYNLTHSGLVLAAFTETLGRWSRSSEFCLNLTMLNRSTAHPDIRSLVGDFIDVNVLGINPNPEDSFARRAVLLQEQLWRDLEHADFSGIEVLREMSRQQRNNVIVPIVYTSTVGLSGDGLDANDFMHNARLRYGITQTPQVWLDCQATERDGSLIVDWDVRQGIFQPGVIEAAHAAFCRLLELLIDDDAVWESRSPVILPKSMQDIRSSVNDTAVELPRDHLHSGFCQHALTKPNAVALVCGQQQLSYLELARKAVGISQAINKTCDQLNYQPGGRIAIVMDKGEDQIAAVLGALLSDSTYVPIEAAQPENRRNTILQDAGANIVLAHRTHHDANWPADNTIIAVDELGGEIDDGSVYQVLQQTFSAHRKLSQNNRKATAEKAAYIIYTSGTTGQPKGVEISHGAALNTVADINRRFDVSPSDKVLGLVSFGFDLSIWDIFGTFSAGATLVLPVAEKRADPVYWAQLMEVNQVTLWNSVPAQLQMLFSSLEWLPDVKLASLRLAMLSGDWIPTALPDQVRQVCPWVDLISLGGPTETSIWCIYHRIGDVPECASSIPYGTPLSNHSIKILNERFEHCPDWVTGEMYIGGAGLALGYVGDEQKTAQAFIYHPDTGERLYKSGDLGRYRPDGVIEIQGRDDGQIKVNGHRIESGEVETAICSHPLIRSAAVVAINQPPVLAAAIVLTEQGLESVSDQQGLIDELSEYLVQQLPAYMLPSHTTILPALPLNANSKVDKKALRSSLANQAPLTVGYEAPLDSALEQKVSQIWCELLNIEKVSRNDDFFHIGGSSMTAINLLSAYLTEGYSADIDLVFNNSVFRDTVYALEQLNAEKAKWLESIDLNDMANTALINLNDAEPFDSGEPIQTVLLTGATGYLGSYVLDRLLSQTDYHIICLMRCNSKPAGMERLMTSAQEKGLAEVDTNRITIVP
ncbi:MAG: amino acid adenylation domain-containing protein, partial [Saccharospirillaceae bacterium]|nr:amino acid adenylation domain-containing protein [Saccharospirillaceae bacterium]